jgi:hypothetical protein
MNTLLATAQALHPSKIDTLQAQVTHLTQIVDSLNKVTANNTIGTGYFHDIIGGVVMIFILIVTIMVSVAGFFSWRWITNHFDRITNRFEEVTERRDADLIVMGEKETATKVYVDKKMKDLEYRHEALQARANLLVFEFIKGAGRREESILWGLLAVQASFLARRKTPAKTNINVVLQTIKSSPLDIPSIKKHFTQTKKVIDDLRKIEGFDLNEQLDEIENLISKANYS